MKNPSYKFVWSEIWSKISMSCVESNWDFTKPIRKEWNGVETCFHSFEMRLEEVLFVWKMNRMRLSPIPFEWDGRNFWPDHILIEELPSHSAAYCRVTNPTLKSCIALVSSNMKHRYFYFRFRADSFCIDIRFKLRSVFNCSFWSTDNSWKMYRFFNNREYADLEIDFKNEIKLLKHFHLILIVYSILTSHSTLIFCLVLTFYVNLINSKVFYMTDN